MTEARRRTRRNQSRDFAGRLMTQSGPRTTAPMWPRPFFTPGEWAVYTALWSYPNDSVFPTHQELADRAWVQRGTAADAVAKMDSLGLLDREPGERDDGSSTSNTYYLIEVPTAEHVTLLDARNAERKVEQESKRKGRKAYNRKYEKPQVSKGAEGGYGEESTPERATRGGTVSTVPGYGVDRTHESLGVTEGSLVTGRTSTSSAGKEQSPLDDIQGQTAEQKDPVSSKIENQEGYAVDGYPLELSDWEAELVADLDRLRPDWGQRSIRIVVGDSSVRERSAASPGLVRRAFLLAAADKPRPVDRHKGTWSPNRLLAAGCPFWSRALAAMEAEAASEADSGQPEFGVPGQREAAAPAKSEPSRVVSPPRVAAFAPATKPPADVAAALATRGIRVGSARDRADAEVAS